MPGPTKAKVGTAQARAFRVAGFSPDELVEVQARDLGGTAVGCAAWLHPQRAVLLFYVPMSADAVMEFWEALERARIYLGEEHNQHWLPYAKGVLGLVIGLDRSMRLMADREAEEGDMEG